MKGSVNVNSDHWSHRVYQTQIADSAWSALSSSDPYYTSDYRYFVNVEVPTSIVPSIDVNNTFVDIAFSNTDASSGKLAPFCIAFPVTASNDELKLLIQIYASEPIATEAFEIRCHYGNWSNKGLTNSVGKIAGGSSYKGEWIEGQSYEVGDIVHVTAWGDPQNMFTGFYICRVAGIYDPYSGNQDGHYWLQINNGPINYSQIQGYEEQYDFQPLLMENSRSHDGYIGGVKHYSLIGPTFRKLSRTPASATVTQTAGTPLSNITVNPTIIFSEMDGIKAKTYVVTYDGTNWYMDGSSNWLIYNPDSLNYSILNFNGVPEAGIEIEIAYIPPVDKFILTNTKTEGLVTSISAQSTDEEYPSALSVYNLVAGLAERISELETTVATLQASLNNVESALEDINSGE